MHIVTAAKTFTDIDSYGSMISLAELLRLKGEHAIAASSAPPNSSVPAFLRSLDVQLERNYNPSAHDVFTIVDLSEPEFFDFDAPIDRVIGVIDHRPDYENYWPEKLGDKARIESVGAACTQIYELWRESGLLDKISISSAKLLASGIQDNTLNLKADITTNRDEEAYDDLAKRAKLPADWPEQYFSACQDQILSDIGQAVAGDAKMVQYPSLPHKTHVGQLALWNAKEFINSNKDAIRKILMAEDLPWYINLIDIHSNKSLFLCENPELKSWIEQLLGVNFKDDIATSNRMWLRKEIMKSAIDNKSAELKNLRQ